MSKITKGGLTRSGTWCFMLYPYGNSGRQRVNLQWFLPTRRYASADLCESNVSVCLSVSPSVTRQYCTKTKES